MKFTCNSGATCDLIEAFEHSTGLKLPNDYVGFLKTCNGGEGFVGEDYLILWRIEELEEFNRDYEVQEYVPGLLLIGSNGGGEAYGFRTDKTPWEIVRVPFVGMSPELAIKVTGVFSDFITLRRT